MLWRVRDSRGARLVKLLLRKRLAGLLGARTVTWQMAGKEDEIEGRHEIVDALNIAGGRVA